MDSSRLNFFSPRKKSWGSRMRAGATKCHSRVRKAAAAAARVNQA